MSLAARLAWRLLRREWRSGELWVLASALVIAVGALCAVTVFTDRIDRSMVASANELLAADLVVHSTEPIAQAYGDEARRRGLSSAHTATFSSVVVSGDQFQLVGTKAVSEAYPLRGELQVASTAFGPARAASSIPAPGTAWIDPRLEHGLALARGQQIELGRARLTVERILAYEPDRAGEMFNVAPRLLINLEDLAATELIRPGSHVHYRLLLAGAENEIAAMRKWLEPRLADKEELQGLRDARPEMRAALERAGQFLGLAALVSVLLSAVAIAVASRRHAMRHFDAVAVMRCLGAPQSLVVRVYAIELAGLGAFACGLGIALGYSAQAVLAKLIGALFVEDLPAPSMLPALAGMTTGLVVLLGFALPPLARLKRVPPLHVLRRELGRVPAHTVGAYVSAAGAFAALVLWQSRDVALAGYVMGGALATAAALWLAAFALVKSLGVLRDRVGVSWRFGFAAIARRGEGNRLQMMAFGVGIAMLLLLGLVRADLLEEWRNSLPADTPNYFLINVQSDEVDVLRQFLEARGLRRATLHPMVRGRLIAVNRQPVKPSDYADPRAQRLAARDFNLSWAAHLQDDNRIVAGHWWGARDDGRALLSVEEEIAADLGFEIGDELSFSIAGERIDARIASLRAVQWDSFRANFFVLFPPGVIESLPATYISSFHLPPQRRRVLTELIREFPSVTVLDLDALLGKVRDLMEQATRAAEYVFMFTLAAGFAVLFAAISASLDERRYEAAVVRTLGAGRAQIVRSLLAEFMTLGALAGVLAALAATLVGAVLAVQVFDFAFRINPWVWAVGVLGGGAGVGIGGLLGTRSVVSEPPLRALRRG